MGLNRRIPVLSPPCLTLVLVAAVGGCSGGEVAGSGGSSDPGQEDGARRTVSESLIVYRCGDYRSGNGAQVGTFVIELRGLPALAACMDGEGKAQIESVRLTLDPDRSRDEMVEIDTAFDYFNSQATVEQSGPMDCMAGAVDVWWQQTKQRDTYSLSMTLDRSDAHATYYWDGAEHEIALSGIVGTNATCPPGSYDRAD